MDNASAIMDLVAGYQTYSDVAELSTTAVVDPVSTPCCVSIEPPICVTAASVHNRY